ncbi:MAG: complex I subunit 4 family protein [Planctomycetota bacterium]|jgi:NADH-quinone oxidoreductase subunit M
MASLIVLLAPVVGCFLLFFAREKNDADKERIRGTAIVFTSISLLASLWMWATYDTAGDRYQFVCDVEWVPSLGIGFRVGADGISIAMVLLTSIVIWTGCYISRSITDRVKEHYILLLALVTGVFGVFLSLDLFFFYFFYEMAVIPMYLLIGVWGSRAEQYSKEYATMKLTLYLTTGAVFALVGLLAVYFEGSKALWGQEVRLAGETFLFEQGRHTFDLRLLAQAPLAAGIQKLWFPVIFLGFACIVPMWPLHSWSPIGHAAAPSAVSMLHAGVLMKLGAYAILRIGFDVLPAGAQHWMGWVAIICCMNILYGGLVAMAQRDMKFIIGFSSSSHMGYVLLGLATMGVVGISGAVFLMFAHGLMTALAFALVGWVYDQAHTRVLDDWGGLIKQMPFVGTCFAIMAMASAGLPGFANFASELLIFLSAWKADFALAGTSITLPGWVPVMAAVWGIVISATYLLRAVREAFFGPSNPRWDRLRDAGTRRQKQPFAALILVLVFFGCFPSTLVDTIKSGAAKLRPVPEASSEADK